MSISESRKTSHLSNKNKVKFMRESFSTKKLFLNKRHNTKFDEFFDKPYSKIINKTINDIKNDIIFDQFEVKESKNMDDQFNKILKYEEITYNHQLPDIIFNINLEKELEMQTGFKLAHFSDIKLSNIKETDIFIKNKKFKKEETRKNDYMKSIYKKEQDMRKSLNKLLDQNYLKIKNYNKIIFLKNEILKNSLNK